MDWGAVVFIFVTFMAGYLLGCEQMRRMYNRRLDKIGTIIQLIIARNSEDKCEKPS